MIGAELHETPLSRFETIERGFAGKTAGFEERDSPRGQGLTGGVDEARGASRRGGAASHQRHQLHVHVLIEKRNEGRAVRVEGERTVRGVGEERAGFDAGGLRERREIAHRKQRARSCRHAHRTDRAVTTAVPHAAPRTRSVTDGADRFERDPVVAPHRVGGRVEQLRNGGERIVRMHQLSAQVARSCQRKEKAVRAPVDQLKTDPAPVFVGVVVGKREGLQHARFACVSQHDSVRRAPDRRLGDVAEGHRAARIGQELDRSIGLRAANAQRIERGPHVARVTGVGRAHLEHVACGEAPDLAAIGKEQERQ